VDPFEKQYRSILLTEAREVFEEEVPNQPIAVTQSAKLACLAPPEANDPAVAGKWHQLRYYLWVGRKKAASQKIADARIRFDQLEEP
jgi:hypothetical protein